MYGTVLPQRWALDLMADKSAVNVIRFFFSSRRRHTRLQGDWSSDVCCLPEFPAGCDRAEPSTAPDPSAPECGKIPKARGLATSRRPPPARPPRGKAENRRTGYRRLTGPYAAWDDRK